MTAPVLSAEARALVALPKGIERHPIVDRRSWLEARKRDVTASVIGALLGVHEYTSALEQWAVHTGANDNDNEQTAAMERGALLEPVAAEVLRRRQPDWQVLHPVGVYYRDPIARIGATPDIFAVDPSRPGFGVVQVKSVEASVFRSKWRRDEDGERVVDPPTWIAVQAITEAALTGASWCAVAPLVVSYGLDMPLIDIPLDLGVFPALRAKVAEFWKMVAAGTPPPADYSKDGALIAKIYGADNGTTVDLSGDNLLPGLLENDERLRDEIGSAKKRRDEIKAQVIEKLGGATFAILNGWRISNKTQFRKSHTVKASEFQVLRPVRTQEKAHVGSF